MNSLDNGIAALRTQIGGLETKFGGLETKIGGLETKIGELETKIASDGSESFHLPLVVLFSLNIYSSLIGVSNLISSSYYFPDSLSVLVPHLLQGQNELDAVLLSFLSFASQPFICVGKSFFDLGIMPTQSSWQGSSLQMSRTSSTGIGNNRKKLL